MHRAPCILICFPAHACGGAGGFRAMTHAAVHQSTGSNQSYHAMKCLTYFKAFNFHHLTIMRCGFIWRK
ncbi:exported hypothetical protein [Paraburkholderia unamae]|nr:exported hypothetical protein [Paraburkholderia unamae]